MDDEIIVLYVDDELGLLEIVRFYLEESGFIVDTAISAEEAMRMLEKKTYDVIVSDYQMVPTTGIEFLKAVRLRTEIPFILFTGKGREEVAMEAINNGASFYVQKGGDLVAEFADLTHKIRKSVEKKRLEDKNRDLTKKILLMNGVNFHDLNNLLGALGLSIELGQAGRSQEIISEMGAVIKEAQSYQRIGKDPQWVSTRDAVDNFPKQFPEYANYHFIDLTYRLSILIDPSIVEMVAHNMVENTKRHGGTKVKNLTLGYTINPDGSLILFYADDGVGMPLEEKSSIFKKGYGKHTGMGLFFIYEILNLVHISIVENGEPGKGARFEMTIPKGRYRFDK